jgi:hypothetical protein
METEASTPSGSGSTTTTPEGWSRQFFLNRLCFRRPHSNSFGQLNLTLDSTFTRSPPPPPSPPTSKQRRNHVGKSVQRRCSHYARRHPRLFRSEKGVGLLILHEVILIFTPPSLPDTGYTPRPTRHRKGRRLPRGSPPTAPSAEYFARAPHCISDAVSDLHLAFPAFPRIPTPYPSYSWTLLYFTCITLHSS